jgi:hypothetical protein
MDGAPRCASPPSVGENRYAILHRLMILCSRPNLREAMLSA